MATTTQHKQIRIDGMTGDECCQKVTEALEQVEGIEVESVEVGNATITASNEQSVTAARQAIDTLGFSARQDVASPKSQEVGKQSGQQQSRQGYRDQNSNQNAASGIGRAAAEGAREGDTGESNEDEPTEGDTAQRPGQNKSHNQGQSDGDQEQDQNLPTADIDRGANAAKKQVGDAGRDDRDRGDPMPERVNGPGTDAKNTNSGQRPANQDRNPSTNSNANANQGVGAQGDKSGQQSSGKR